MFTTGADCFHRRLTVLEFEQQPLKAEGGALQGSAIIVWYCKTPEPKIDSDRPFLCSRVAGAWPSLLTSVCLPSSLKGDVAFHASGSH